MRAPQRLGKGRGPSFEMFSASASRLPVSSYWEPDIDVTESQIRIVFYLKILASFRYRDVN